MHSKIFHYAQNDKTNMLSLSDSSVSDFFREDLLQNLKKDVFFIEVRKVRSTLMEAVEVIEVAKITSKGQVTIPKAVRRKMHLNEGDKIMFLEQDGRVFVENAALIAISRAQEAFAGEAGRSGLSSEEDVVSMIKEIRQERWECSRANNA